MSNNQFPPAGPGDPEKPAMAKDDLEIDTSTKTHDAHTDTLGRTMPEDHGSPLEPPPQIAGEMSDERKTQSAPVGLDAISKEGATSPTNDNDDPAMASPPMPRHPRTSLQLNRPQAQPRTSTQKARASEEFDRRFDGPFGRPSLAMTRRRSSQQPQIMEDTEMDMVEPTVTTSGGEQVPVPPFRPEPPRLGYTLRTRKMAIFLFWSVILFDSVVMPIALYFGLWYGVGPGNPDDERLSANTVFSIVTAALGGASILEYFVRFWRLYKKNSTCRVIGAHRWYLDWFHWMFTLAWIIVMIELIVGSVQEDPYIRLLSMPLATMLYVFGTLLLIIDIARYFKIPAPVRISSIPKGSQLRPGIYSLIEDICAVDGSGGTDYRVAFDKRYEASHIFRSMLRKLGIFWAVGAEACAVLCTILIFTLSADAAYTIGWSVPFIWAGIWTAATFWYAKRELKKEKELWAAEAAKCRA
ncbi:hypothetical protein E8E14_007240 [Neopestalotiopsis sp. 37M]|nr:hypothetical protein E8E14_007240 [Neopestalotiopsis sp. 37M]